MEYPLRARGIPLDYPTVRCYVTGVDHSHLKQICEKMKYERSATVDGFDGLLYREMASPEELDGEHTLLVESVRLVAPQNTWEVETVFFPAGALVADEKDHRFTCS
jgi:hypothetical protein